MSVGSYFITDPYYTSALGLPPMLNSKSIMENFLDYLRKIHASKATIVAGPNGKFISVLYKEGATPGPKNFPIGKKSQNGELSQFNALCCEDGAVIATVNQYEDLESMDL